MQVLLPYPNLRLSAHVLHRDDLSRQQAHAVEILMRLSGRGRSVGRRWFAPVLLWTGREPALLRYVDGVWRERRDRGMPLEGPSPASPEGAALYDLRRDWLTDPVVMPDWLGIEQMHSSHRAVLRATRPAWYAQFAWQEPPARSAWWPAQLPSVGERVLGPDGRVWWIAELADGGYDVILGRDRVRVTVREMRERVWQRVVGD